MKKYTGQCLCGKIKFNLSGNPIDPHLCYCKMCQSWAGAPVVAWVSFSLSSLKYQSGKPTLYHSSKNTTRGFCSTCGSTLFALDDDSREICMTICNLKDKNLLIPKSESFKKTAPKWLHIQDISD